MKNLMDETADNETLGEKNIYRTHLVRITFDTKSKLDELRKYSNPNITKKYTYNSAIAQLLHDADNLILLRSFLECIVPRYSWCDRQKSLEHLQVEINRQIQKEIDTKAQEEKALATLEDRYFKKKEKKLMLKELDLLLKKKP